MRVLHMQRDPDGKSAIFNNKKLKTCNEVDAFNKYLFEDTVYTFTHNDFIKYG